MIQKIWVLLPDGFKNLIFIGCLTVRIGLSTYKLQVMSTLKPISPPAGTYPVS